MLLFQERNAIVGLRPFSWCFFRVRVHAEVGHADAVTRLWTVDDAALRIAWRGQWLLLTPLEFRMLRHLLAQPGRVFSRAQLLDSAHGDLRDVSDRAIDTHVKNLRRKIQAVRSDDDCITSVYGVGYRFDRPRQ